MKEKPNYYAIIPANVRYDKDLKANEKLLYGEITALTNSKGYCFATNSYFGKLYGVHKNTAGNWVNNLIKHGYVFAKYVYGENKEVKERKLYITPINEKIDRYQQKDLEGITEKIDTPINEKIEGNNTSFNITSVNKGQQNDNEIVTDKFKQVFEKDTLDSSKDKKEELYKNSSAYENDIKNIIGTHDIQISTIKKTGKSKQRIKEVVEFAEKNGKNDAWIVWALREDKELIDPNPKTQIITETIMNDDFEWVTVKREVPIHYNGR